MAKPASAESPGDELAASIAKKDLPGLPERDGSTEGGGIFKGGSA